METLVEFGVFLLVLSVFPILAILGYWLFVKCFTTVKQGTQKIVVRFGKYVRTLDPGLNFVGFWPIHKVYTYKFGWTGIDKDGKVQDHKKEEIDFVLVKDDVYACIVDNAEDHNLLPLKWTIALTIRIVDAKKALFDIQNWFETLMNRVSPYVRDFTTNYTYEKLIQEDMKLEKKILESLQAANIITEFENDYGIKILKLEVKNVDPPAEFRQATLKKWDAQRIAAARSIGTMDTLIMGIATLIGQKPEEIQEEFKKDLKAALKKYAGIIAMNKEFIEQQIASDAKSLRRYHFTGASGGMDLVALLGEVLASGKSSSGESSSDSKKKDKDKKAAKDPNGKSMKALKDWQKKRDEGGAPDDPDEDEEEEEGKK